MKMKSSTTVKAMTEGSILRHLLLFSLPLLGGNLFQQAYNLIDAAIVGRTLGADALAAVGASSSVQFLVLGFCMGICIGMAIPIATAFGARRYHEMRQYLYIGAVLAAVIALLLAVITVVLCPQILHMMKTPEEIFTDADRYLRTIFAGIPVTVFYNYLAGILRAVGDSVTPFFFLALCSFVNVALDLVFIKVLGMGCFGAALATVAAQAISCGLCFLVILRRFEILHFRAEDRVWNRRMMIRMLNMGIPMGIQFSITAIGSMVMQTCNNALGTVYVAGFAAAMKIKQLFISPYDSLATASATFVSQNFGARHRDRIHKGYRTALGMGFVYCVVSASVLIFFGRQLSMLFLKDGAPAILDAAEKFLKYNGYFWFILGILIITRQTVQGLGWSKRAIVGGCLEMAARSVVCLGLTGSLGFTAICFADASAWFSSGVYCVILLGFCFRHVDRILNNRS
ncbi:MAG: MATE family efflux transporter [Lachnospiraceae bacterium]|nr:MATE family efflux transporter [Lachnospiraceae bacterium]